MPTKNLKRFLQSTATEWGWSRWETLERCPMEYSLAYIHHIRPLEEPRYRHLGIAVHRGLAASYSGLQAKTVIDAGNEPTDVRLEAKALVHAHDLYWAEHDPGFDKVVAVERAVAGQVGNAQFTSRYDLVAKRGKDYLLVDHKTASREGDTTREFSMSGQFHGALAIWPYRKRVAGVMINKLIKKLPRFERSVISIPDRQVDSFRRDLDLLETDRQRYQRSNHYPRRRHSCVRRYGVCPFFDLCHMGPGARANFKMDGITAFKLQEILK